MPDAAWIADVPDAFVSVWQDRGVWRFRVRSAAGRVWQSDLRGSPAGAKTAAAREYRTRVGQDAQGRLCWSPCSPTAARGHGDAARAESAARRFSAHAESAMRPRETAASPPKRVAPDQGQTRTGTPARPVALEHYLELLCGRVPLHAPAYLSFLHRLPCCTTGRTDDIVAHHEPPKGMGGGRSTDYHAVPLLRRLHDIRHGAPPKPGEPTADDIERVCLAARLPCVLAYYCGQAGPGRMRP